MTQFDPVLTTEQLSMWLSVKKLKCIIIKISVRRIKRLYVVLKAYCRIKSSYASLKICRAC